MRLVLDMNLAPRWTSVFRDRGWEAEHWSRIGDPKSTDAKIAEWARIEGWIVVTNDMDFPQLLAHTRGTGPSVVLLRGEPLTPEVRGEHLCRILTASSKDLEAGAIVSVDWAEKLRIRLLPIG
jgi:predicted nuclease of predicted toxin-antitoxin system